MASLPRISRCAGTSRPSRRDFLQRSLSFEGIHPFGSGLFLRR
jgi:hypothetical protein